jgi:hypothetical protein
LREHPLRRALGHLRAMSAFFVRRAARALSFDGTSGYVWTADSPALRPEATNEFTVGFRVKLDADDNNVLPRLWEKGAHYMAVMGDPANGMFRRVAIEVQNAEGSGNENGGASEFWGSARLTTGVWHVVVGVFDASRHGNQGQIYIDGQPEAMRTIFSWSGTLSPTAGRPLLIARRDKDQARNLRGQMTWFAYWPRALRAWEVRRLAAGRRPPGAGLRYTWGAQT